MEVYEFNKNLLTRLEECMDVLCWKDEIIPASQVRNEWSYYIELQIEPAGWQALWKIPRIICNELGLRYPTVVLGTVEQVFFKELKAIFMVEAVQDEDVHVPECHEVNLEDLFPTIKQENNALNVDRTANCLDKLRFFYKNVWMPWDIDNDDDVNWVEKHLESRIRFCYDLRRREMKRGLAVHIRTLLVEARYAQQQREYLELDMSDDEKPIEEDMKNSSFDEKSRVTDLMRIHMRLTMIRSEIEMLENAELRNVYEEIKFSAENTLKQKASDFLALQNQNLIHDNNINNNNNGGSESFTKFSFIVSQPDTLANQLKLLQLAQNYMPAGSPVQIHTSLQHVFKVCEPSVSIFLAPGKHSITSLEYLNENGRICGLIDKTQKSVHQGSDGDKNKHFDEVMLVSPDHDSILLIFDGDFILENLVLNCSFVRTGIIIKNGKLILRNCRISGDGKTSTQNAINCANKGHILLDNCTVENFATGLIMQSGAKVVIKDSTFKNCQIAIDVSGQHSEMMFEGLQNNLTDCKIGINAHDLTLANNACKHLILEKIDDLKASLGTDEKMPKWLGKCNFLNCSHHIYVVNQENRLLKKSTLQHIMALDADSIEDSILEE